jgi:hypothetical protein
VGEYGRRRGALHRRLLQSPPPQADHLDQRGDDVRWIGDGRLSGRQLPARPARALPAVAAIPPTTSALAEPSKPLDNPPPARLPVLHITVRPWGFEPKQITRQKGDFALWVDNRSGLSELNVHLIRETGEAAQDRQIYKRRYDWLSYYDLTPGRYVLTEADHRQWECRITITANKTYASSLSYTAHGAVSAMLLGNGKWEHTNYNSRLQPEQIGLGASSADSSILRLDYGYGTTTNNGNVQTQRIVIAGLDVTQSYTYDELNRLKTANESSGANWSQSYGYDRWGNRWVSASTGYTLSSLTPTGPGAFNTANNRLIASGHDAVGNHTLDVQGRTFEYDGENRQTKFNNTVGQYFYDGDGRRVKKIDNTGTMVFVYNAGGQGVRC